MPPADGARVAADIASKLPAETYFDWGGGLVWLAVDPAVERAGPEVIRDAVRLGGGHATLIRAPDTVRASADVFHPQAATLAALSARVKESFRTRNAFSIPAVCTPGSDAENRHADQFYPCPACERRYAGIRKVLRTCVHCGFCTATCPTYVLLGDELDSPRGRIYLMKDMLENDKPANDQVVKHIDRCLSCLSCMTTCPSGVHYMHLVDHGRAHIEKTYRRPASERLMRKMLSTVLPRPGLFRMALMAAKAGRPVAG